MKFWLLAVVIPGAFAFTDSVWQNEEEEAESFGEVIIKSFSDDGQRVTVSVLPVGASGASLDRETLELCPAMVQAQASSEAPTTPKSLLQHAFDRGQRVRVQYDGTFKRCISEVQASVKSI